MDQDPEDILIELLNGRRGLFSSTTVSGTSNEVFLDQKGRPTDRFLEALKRTGTGVSSPPDDADSSDASDSSYTEDSSPEDDDEEYDEDVFEQSWARKNSRKKSSDTRWKGVSEGKTNEHRAPRSASKVDMAVKKKKVKTSSSKNTSKTSINNSTIKGGLEPTARSTPPSSSSHPHSHPHHYHGPDFTDGGGSGSPVHTTTHTHDISGVVISADSKEVRTIRSLQLRLSGQLQTIRVLEGQLGESNSLLEARTKQLSLVENRLKQLQLSVDNTVKGVDGSTGGGGTSNGSPSGCMPGSAASASKLLREVRAEAMENVERQRAQTDALHARWMDEQSRRVRADERSKLLKEYAERAKAQVIPLLPGYYPDRSTLIHPIYQLSYIDTSTIHCQLSPHAHCVSTSIHLYINPPHAPHIISPAYTRVISTNLYINPYY